MTNEPPIIRNLNIPMELRKEVQDIMDDGNYSPSRKKHIIKDKTGVTGCCICHNKVPDFQIQYPSEGVIIIENYCSNCYTSYLERTTKEPNTISEIADYYGCVKAEQQ